MSRRVAGLVLAAGSSRRLGRPKQLLALRGSTLLATTLSRVRCFGLDQLVVAVGGAGPEVRAGVDLSGFTVVDSVHHTEGCSSSIVAALAAMEPDVSGFLLFLGDQPDVPAAAVDALLALALAPGPPPPLVLCRYDDGRGHPFWFHRSLFPELSRLHGDKAVWKLVESGRWPVAEARVRGPIPIDVDTWDDYQRLLATPAP
jgi:molybdenum cofactor cytidylyltransferase